MNVQHDGQDTTDFVGGTASVGELSARSHIRHLRGAAAILAQQDLLQQFAAACAQPTAMHGLEFILQHEYTRSKTPHLVCIVSGPESSAQLSPHSLFGCVLLFEYRLGSWNTGLFATGDSTGIRTVLAPVALRVQVAALGAAALLRHGRVVLTCFRSASEAQPQIDFPETRGGMWAAQTRGVQDRLLLGPTLDLTLNTMGKRTRTHLRYYRRRLQAETGCVFVPDAAAHIPQTGLEALNAASLEPVQQRVFNLQFSAAANHAGGFVCGLRAADGRWLSLAGGWRQQTTTLIQWQVNAAGVAGVSLSTAMRAFLIEQEVALGTRELIFHGGTSHSISHAFQQDYAVDLVLRRPGRVLSLLARLVRYFAERDPALANRGNFLVDALRSRKLRWAPLSRSR